MKTDWRPPPVPEEIARRIAQNGSISGTQCGIGATPADYRLLRERDAQRERALAREAERRERADRIRLDYERDRQERRRLRSERAKEQQDEISADRREQTAWIQKLERDARRRRECRVLIEHLLPPPPLLRPACIPVQVRVPVRPRNYWDGDPYLSWLEQAARAVLDADSARLAR